VVDTDKLRGKWKPFEARRELMRENEVWLCDERIVPSLPKLLGKVFLAAKK
jgi:ribosome biogenesis protein UTP30